MKAQKQFIRLLLLMTVLVATLFAGCTGESGDMSNTGDTSGDQDRTQTLSNYSWIVEPKFDYPNIGWHHGAAVGPPCDYGEEDVFTVFEEKLWIISAETGEKIEEHILGHAAGSSFVAYDPNNKKYGVMNLIEETYLRVYDNWGEAVANGIGDNGTLFPVMQIQITQEEINPPHNVYLIYDGEGVALSGGLIWGKKYAVANKDGILTDFIFDSCDMYYSSFYTAHDTGSLAMEIDGKWGFVGSDGKFVVEPVFEDAISINAERAFVKLNGKWGIISKNV
ncbi:MAG: WG repeat-containing protein [Peptococcaceae bacterium]|nr:WG repeat-containing protein [Peptococcaceae bacterium]